MKIRSAARPLLLAAAIAVVVALPASDALAGKGDKISMRVNGKNVRYRGKNICDGFTQAGVSFVGGPRRYHLGQTVRAVSVACADFDLSSTKFPVTPQFCLIGYTEIKVKVPPTSKQWGSSSTAAAQVTFTSFDGTRATGTFSGTLAAESGTTTPATITNGKFSLNLPDTDCTGVSVAGN